MYSGVASTSASRPPRKGKKYFTVAEANRALVYVSKVVDEITGCYHEVMELRKQIEQVDHLDSQNPIRVEYEGLMDSLNELIDELHQVGVELKDLELGLLDFPSVYEGREIYLCWRRGESEVSAWHEVDAGYAGRQDVSVMTV
jgi:hypothetical protein